MDEGRLEELKRALRVLAKRDREFVRQLFASVVDEEFVREVILSRQEVVVAIAYAVLTSREAVNVLVSLLARDEDAVRAFTLLVLSNPASARVLLDTLLTEGYDLVVRSLLGPAGGGAGEGIGGSPR